MWYYLDKKYGIKKETQAKLITKAATKIKKAWMYQVSTQLLTTLSFGV